mgnify:CR=1 FL=1
MNESLAASASSIRRVRHSGAPGAAYFVRLRDGAEALGHLTDPVELLRKNRADGRSPAVQKAVLQRIDWVEHLDARLR